MSHQHRIFGPYGKAWTFDLDAIRQKRPNPKDCTVELWMVKATWAHPLWHSYIFILLHLRPAPDGSEPFKYRPDVTHELMVYALDPKWEMDLTDCPHDFMLHPCNYAGQFTCHCDEEAIAKMRQAVQDVCAGNLNPDTDARQQWIDRFGDTNMNLMKRTLVAGLEIDMRAKLFWLLDNGTLEPVSADDWIRILDSHKAEMGQLMEVVLTKPIRE